MDNLKKIRRGSFTIEAAGLMGVVLLVIFSVLYVEIYVLNRDWLTISAYEAAITGGMEERMEEGSSWMIARERGELLKNTGSFGIQDLTLGVTGGKEVEVWYTGRAKALLGGFETELFCKGKYRVIEPVKVLQNIRILESAGNVLKGEE